MQSFNHYSKTVLKLFVLIIAILCMLSACSQNNDSSQEEKNQSSQELTLPKEKFKLREGIKFGDNKNTVKANESLNYVNENSAQVYFRGVIEGIKGSEVSYYFDNYGELNCMTYALGPFAFASIDVSYYNDMKAKLTERYGKPLGYTNGTTSILLGHRLQYYLIDLYETEKITKGTHKILKYDEWLVPCAEGVVKVELTYVDRDGYADLDLSYDLFPGTEPLSQMDKTQDLSDGYNGHRTN